MGYRSDLTRTSGAARSDVTPSFDPGGRRAPNLAFWHEQDPDSRQWRFVGSRAGLTTLVTILRRFADQLDAGDRTPRAMGSPGELELRFWDQPGIDDEGVHGPADAFRDLADQIGDRLADATPGMAFSVGDRFASHAEYTLHVDLRRDGFDPADATPLPAAVDSAPPPVPLDTRVFAVPASVYDPDAGFTESHGILRLTETALELQFETKDAFFGLFKSGVREASLPFEEIAAVQFARKWHKTELVVTATDLRAVEGVPGVKGGRLRLRFARADRDDAEELAAELRAILALA